MDNQLLSFLSKKRHCYVLITSIYGNGQKNAHEITIFIFSCCIRCKQNKNKINNAKHAALIMIYNARYIVIVVFVSIFICFYSENQVIVELYREAHIKIRFGCLLAELRNYTLNFTQI